MHVKVSSNDLSDGDVSIDKYIQYQQLEELFEAAALAEKGKNKFKRTQVGGLWRPRVFSSLTVSDTVAFITYTDCPFVYCIRSRSKTSARHTWVTS